MILVCRSLSALLISAASLTVVAGVPARASGSQPLAPPLQVRLDVPLETRKLILHAPLFASVTVPWHGPDCFLKKGATVSGHVLDVVSHSKGAPASQITLAFDQADCNGQRSVAVPLLLYAVISAPDEPAASAMSEGAGRIGNGDASAPHVGGGSRSGAGMTRNQTMLSDLNAPRGTGDGPSAVRAGEVLGLEGVTMSVGTDPATGSVLHSKKQDFHVGVGTLLVLVVVPTQHRAADPALEQHISSVAPPVPIPPPTPVVPPPVDETEICAADCSTTNASEGGAKTLNDTGASSSVSLVRFGYRPQQRVLLETLDHDATVHFLGPDEVLVTFDPHQLRKHTGVVWRPTVQRNIRAVLLNHAGEVKRVVDWKLEGGAQYLWADGPGRVILRTEGGLRVLGPGLRTEKVIPCAGEVIWVSVSPSGEHLVYGVLRERHTEVVHRKIAELSGRDPEEDLEVHRMELATGREQVEVEGDRAAVPVLTNNGSLRVQAAGRTRWAIHEQLWSGADQRIATINSACAPEVLPAGTNLIFVLGCTGDSSGPRWYRVLREDGHTVLKSQSSSEEFAQTIEAGGPAFALRIVHTAKSFAYRTYVRGDDLESETTAVYREANGQQLFSVKVKNLIESNENFALSPDGRELAVLTADTVVLHSIVDAH